MYRINKSSNTVTRLDQRLFKDLKIKEREHLQEWIAQNPQMLGEDLLIIQKEFDGFNDTHERLDLLALDKNGGIVVIENKLDDTGRNVVWQALKYTSYCSTLKTNQIMRMYQDYLNQQGLEQDAKENILEFLERDDEDLLLNRNDQRIIFVANNYRKEVTSTVLWLIKHDIQVQCFRATPYSMNDEMFLQVEQIIPLPETTEFMIDIKEKEKEEEEKSKAVAENEARLIEFWGKLKTELTNRNYDYLDRVKAKPYYNIGFWNGPGVFGYNLGKHTIRVELYISNDPDKTIFDTMSKYREKIDVGLESYMVWERLDNKKASRIKYEMPVEEFNEKIGGRFNEENNWDKRIEWYANSMKTFHDRIFPYWDKVLKELA